VEDNGRGIKPDFLPHIFERFRQEDATSKRNQGGLGLGLAIVHRLVEMHGGSVTAESEGEGRGARFTVRLPLEGADEANRGGTRRDATEPRSLEPEPLRGVRVLVVEDDEDSRRLLLRTLTRAGAEVSAVSSVRAALVTLSEFRPNVLVSDVGMPDQDGYDLVREARAQGLSARELPAIALTAFARSEDEERSLEAGFQVHLSKPVDQGRLVAALVSVTANRAEPG
jgi:CheY-like chemotaxis protein